MHSKRIYFKIIANLLLTVIGITVTIFFLPKIMAFFYPFVIAFIISLIANPLVKFMERRIKIVRKHSSAIIIIVSITAIFGLLYLIGYLISKQVVSLIEDLPNITNSLTQFMEDFSERFSKASSIMPKGLKDFFSNFNANAEESVTNFLSSIEIPSLPQMSNYVKEVANGIFMGIITIMATYFFIAERDKMVDVANRIFPESLKKGYKLIFDNFKNAVGGYFKAQFKIMIVLMLVMFLAFEMMNVSYSLLIAFGIAFLDFLPIFGTGAVFWPWAIIEIVGGNYLRAVFIIILYLVCQLVKQLLQPKMVGDSIGINPFTALLFMFIGYRVQGILGMILGIPVGMVVINFYRLGMFDRIIRGFKIILSDINEFRKY